MAVVVPARKLMPSSSLAEKAYLTAPPLMLTQNWRVPAVVGVLMAKFCVTMYTPATEVMITPDE